MINNKNLILLMDETMLPYKAQVYIATNFDDGLFKNIDSAKNQIVSATSEAVYLKLKNAISEKIIDKVYAKMQKYDVYPITFNSPEFPDSLKNIPSSPLVLYTKGDKSLLKEAAIAIVGTRNPTNYGREVTKVFATALSKAGLVTVSGLAYGLDMEVALATLEAQGKTIAVLGGGLDVIYPAQNAELSKRIVKNGGLLMSLYPPLRRPTRYSFVERNRIISGLSLGTIVVEAGESSGTLNTAKHTIEQGRELFVIPANIFSTASVGSNKLIEELPETFTTSPTHVLKVLNFKPKEQIEIAPRKNKELSDNEKLIVNVLYTNDMDFDTLKEKTNLDAKYLISLLTRMEISGLIKKLPGNIYTL